MHKPKFVLENETNEILWGFDTAVPVDHRVKTKAREKNEVLW